MVVVHLPEVDGQQNVPKQRLDDDTRGAGRAHNGPMEPYEPGDMPPGPAAAVTPRAERSPEKFDASWLATRGRDRFRSLYGQRNGRTDEKKTREQPT